VYALSHSTAHVFPFFSRLLGPSIGFPTSLLLLPSREETNFYCSPIIPAPGFYRSRPLLFLLQRPDRITNLFFDPLLSILCPPETLIQLPSHRPELNFFPEDRCSLLPSHHPFSNYEMDCKRVTPSAVPQPISSSSSEDDAPFRRLSSFELP